jgi:hypothetical protein
MAYDDDRERRRLDDEYRQGDWSRRETRGTEESRWPGESSWGYGREYDERYPEQPRGFSDRGPYRSSRLGYDYGRPPRTRNAEQFQPRTVHRYGVETFERPMRDWQPEGVYGGARPGEPLFTGGGFESWRTDPERFRSSWRRQPRHSHAYRYAAGSYDEPGYGISGYGTTRPLAGIPRGRFTGRGPKGYQRSDERIREDVSEDLSQSGEIDASEIEVKVNGCVVTLDGEVETREDKRLAEDIAETTPGVRDVHNNLRVKRGFFARLFGSDEEEERENTYSPRESR